mgnify:CR=1 FL=1
MNIIDLTVHELQEKIKNKELTITEITKAYVDRINEKEIIVTHSNGSSSFHCILQ